MRKCGLEAELGNCKFACWAGPGLHPEEGENGLGHEEANGGEAEPSRRSWFQFKPGRGQGEDVGKFMYCAVVFQKS